MFTMKNSLSLPSVLLLSVTFLTGCSGNDDLPIDTSQTNLTEVINEAVSAGVGGVFSSPDGRLSINIPADSLAENSQLLVMESEGLIQSNDNNLSRAGNAFSIDFGTTLSEPAEISLTIAQTPIHPALAENATVENDQWVRASANFYRPSDKTIVSLISRNGTYQPVYRTLQSESGDSVDRGKDVFLNATFGNERFFGGVIGLHEVLNEVTPAAAVDVGVQVDISRVPQNIAAVLTGSDFAAKQAALQSSAVTRALLKADAIVGVKAFYEDPASDIATSAGITCAVCHARVATTDFEIVEGELSPLPIGDLMLDGVPNTKMDVGRILSLTPFAISAGQDTINFLQSFGAGRFDARALPDNPLEDNLLNPTSIPQLWNFLDLAEQGYTLNWDGAFSSAEDPDNALASRAELVFDLVMHANGAFGTDSSGVPAELVPAPAQSLVDALVLAEDNEPGNVIDEQSLLDIQSWQRSIVSPAPLEFNESLAEAGFKLFNGKAQCSSCHQTAEFTGPVKSADITLVPPIGGLAEGIKTPGLRGIAHIAPYLHDDSAQSLEEVVDIYSGRVVNELTAEEKQAVVEYLKSL